MVRPGRAAKKSQDGAVLLVALFVIIFSMSAGLLVAASLNLRMELVRQQARDLQLDALLDAGMAQSLAELSLSRSYQGTRSAVKVGRGYFEILARQQNSVLTVNVASGLGGHRRQVEAQLSLFPLQVLSWRRVPFDKDLWRDL